MVLPKSFFFFCYPFTLASINYSVSYGLIQKQNSLISLDSLCYTLNHAKWQENEIIQPQKSMGTVACQATLCMGSSMQKYQSGLPFPTLGDLLTPGSNPCPLCLLNWQAVLLPLSHLGSPTFLYSITELKVWKICIEFLLDLCQSRKTGSTFPSPLPLQETTKMDFSATEQKDIPGALLPL